MNLFLTFHDHRRCESLALTNAKGEQKQIYSQVKHFSYVFPHCFLEDTNAYLMVVRARFGNIF